MTMKKAISIILALSLFAAMPFYTIAAEDLPRLSVDKKMTATQEVTLTGENAPNILIQPDASYPDTFSFTLYLTGAVFSGEYGISGTLETTAGVSYSRINDKQMLFQVDAAKSGVRETVLKIPLFTTLKEDGDISVKLDSPNANVFPSKTFTFATLEERAFTFTSESVTDFQLHEANIGPIKIKDLTYSSLPENTEYILQLDNQFVFTNRPEMELTGKYTDNVIFEIDSKNPSIAHLRMRKTTPYDDGVISLYSLTVKPGNRSNGEEVNLTLIRPDGEATIQVGRTITQSTYNTVITIDSFEGGYRPVATGTAAPRKKLMVRVDGEDFGEVEVDKAGKWAYEYPYEFVSLKPGKHIFAVGYYTASNERWFHSVSREFEILPDKTTTTVAFTMDSPTYSYGGRPGYLDVPAYINDYGYAMLPLRAVTQTLGIEPENLQWNAQTQTATIKKDNTTVICQIGNKTIYVNQQPLEMETAAVIKNGITFLPMRSILKSLGISDDMIQWDKDTKTVSFEI